MPLVVLCFSSSLRNASSAAAVGAKLQCALCAEKANRNRGSTKKGVPHLIASSASGATLLRIAYSRRRCGWPSRGAAWMYSAIVAGRSLAISPRPQNWPCPAPGVPPLPRSLRLSAGCVERDRGTDERLEGTRVEFLPRVDVDRAPCVPVEARVEEP